MIVEIRTKFDYIKKRPGFMVLSHDGVTPRILIICGFNGDTFERLGSDGQLTGEALKDYKKWSKL